MWIKRKGCETVNLDFVQSIKKCTPDEYDTDEYSILFYQRGDNEVEFFFDSEDELNDYYDALMNFIEAQEIPTLKI